MSLPVVFLPQAADDVAETHTDSRERNADVLIVAVQHGRRSPRGWRDKI